MLQSLATFAPGVFFTNGEKNRGAKIFKYQGLFKKDEIRATTLLPLFLYPYLSYLLSLSKCCAYQPISCLLR